MKVHFKVNLRNEKRISAHGNLKRVLKYAFTEVRTEVVSSKKTKNKKKRECFVCVCCASAISFSSALYLFMAHYPQSMSLPPSLSYYCHVILQNVLIFFPFFHFCFIPSLKEGCSQWIRLPMPPLMTSWSRFIPSLPTTTFTLTLPPFLSFLLHLSLITKC